MFDEMTPGGIKHPLNPIKAPFSYGVPMDLPMVFWDSSHLRAPDRIQRPGVPIASVLSTNLGWGFVLCYVLSYMLVSMGPLVLNGRNSEGLF